LDIKVISVAFRTIPTSQLKLLQSFLLSLAEQQPERIINTKNDKEGTNTIGQEQQINHV